MRRRAAAIAAAAILILCAFGPAAGAAFAQPGQSAGQISSTEQQNRAIVRNLFGRLNSSGPASGFRPLTQGERNARFTRSFINPAWYAKSAVLAARRQWIDAPPEWEQGASGYSKRFGDVLGQYAIRRTVSYGVESWFHEDNRYFPSANRGFWRRTAYALSSGILARHDNGRRYPSVSLVAGYAGGACLSRFWQPASSRSIGDAAVSFGIGMGWNIGYSVAKEFLPGVLRILRPPADVHPGGSPTKASGF